MTLLTFLAALGLAGAHLFAGALRFLHGTPRSIWLSIAGGISVSYVFLHLLPEVAQGGEALRETVEAGGHLRKAGYLVALLGLILFYGLELAARSAKRGAEGDAAGETASRGIFWLHVASFSVYNMLVGYLLLHRADSVLQLGFFFVALLLHFLVTDDGLRQHHRQTYVRTGRWLLSAAVLFGWLAGVTLEIPHAVVGLAIAFLAGGIMLNVLKEELPEDRESRFVPFFLGALVYALLLLAL